jgi:dTDP-4-amino-4,6-dideoxygalactose transaminase
MNVKIPVLDEWNQRRKQIAQIYLTELSDVPGLVLPHIDPSADSAWHLFVVQHPERDQLQRRLKENQIGTMIHYPIPPHEQPAYSELGSCLHGKFPIAELSLPIGPHLSIDDAARVADAVREACWQLASDSTSLQVA